MKEIIFDDFDSNNKQQNNKPEIIFDVTPTQNINNDNKNKRKKKNKNIKYIIIIFLLLLTYSTAGFTLYKTQIIKQQKAAYNDAVEYCSSMYDNDILKDNIELENINLCLEKTSKINDVEKRTLLENKNNEAKDYITLKEKINTYFENDIVKSTVTEEEINDLYNESNNLNEIYINIIKEKIDIIKSEYEYMVKVKKRVDELFTSSEKTNVKSDITRENYNETKTLVDNLKQEDLKQQLEVYLNKVDETLKDLEDEKRKQELINNSWVKLNVPYISQNNAGVYNGCEAASLLMCLKYKGQLKNMDLVTFATNMPKTDNPNTGFYLDIFSSEPKGVAHWIAPSPLVSYGVSSSGYSNIIDATGWSLDDLNKEIANNNPVVIYLTSRFVDAKNWSNGAPSNLHVLVLAGYNKITKDQLIIDPWTRSNNQYEFTVSKSVIESVYNQVGKKAVVVR